MIKTRNELKEYIRADRRSMHLDQKNLIVEWVKGNTDDVYLYLFVMCLRRFELYTNTYKTNSNIYYGIRYIIYKHFFNYLRRSFDLFISPNVFGQGLNIVHFGYIWVDNSSVIGRNCTILPRVLLGKKHPGIRPPMIFIGDNCYIGTGSTILGPVRIGDNVTIAAGAVVINDIPDNVVVAGNPARVIKTIS